MSAPLDVPCRPPTIRGGASGLTKRSCLHLDWTDVFDRGARLRNVWPMSPAAERNKQPILDALTPWLPSDGLVLEVASGSGVHVAHFARALPGLRFQPTDQSAEHFELIEAATQGLSNVASPIVLDASEANWPVDEAAFVFNANMIHISPFDAARGLFAGAGRLLRSGARMATYGPYLEDEIETAPSNLAFDQSLRARSPEWGIRRREQLESLAQQSGLRLEGRIQMPANNLLLIWRRT